MTKKKNKKKKKARGLIDNDVQRHPFFTTKR